MKNLRALLRRFVPSAIALTVMSLASCTTYSPGGYYGATTGATYTDGDGKTAYGTEEYTPPPNNYVAPAYVSSPTVYVGASYYPYYEPYYPSYYASWYPSYSSCYYPRYSSSYCYPSHHYSHNGHYSGGGGHYNGGSHYNGGGSHYGGGSRYNGAGGTRQLSAAGGTRYASRSVPGGAGNISRSSFSSPARGAGGGGGAVRAYSGGHSMSAGGGRGYGGGGGGSRMSGGGRGGFARR